MARWGNVFQHCPHFHTVISLDSTFELSSVASNEKPLSWELGVDGLIGDVGLGTTAAVGEALLLLTGVALVGLVT